MEKKHYVKLPSKNKLGKLGHQFIEVKIADELYSTIMNSIKSNENIENLFNDIDTKIYKTNLVSLHPFLKKLDDNYNNNEVISKYEFYQKIALKLTHERDHIIGELNAIGKIITGEAMVRSEIDELKDNIKNLILVNKKIKHTLENNPTNNLTEIELDKIKKIKAKHKNTDCSTLDGNPRSVILIEYALISRHKIGNYLYGDESQSERSENFADLYGASKTSVLRTKNKLSLNNKNDLKKIFENRKVLEISILFVLENLEKEKENIDSKLLKYLLEFWK